MKLSLLNYIQREGLATCKKARPRGVQLEIPTDEPEKMDVGKPSSSKAKEDDVLVVIDSSEKNQSPEKDDVTGPSNIAVEDDTFRGKRSGKEIVFTESDESSDDVTMDGSKSFPEVVKGWYERNTKKEAHLRDRVSRYREKMRLQERKIAKLSKRVRKLNKSSGTVHKGREAVRILAKDKVEHEKEMKGLKKEMEAMQEKLNQVNGELECEKETVGREKEARVALEESLARVSSERKWLIEEGFEHVVNRLHGSREYLKLLGAVQTKLWSSGAHYGVVAGYECRKECVDVKDDSLYNPKAYEEFLKAVLELEHTRFPYVVALSQCVDHTLDELKALEPVGMENDEEEVGGGGGGEMINREV